MLAGLAVLAEIVARSLKLTWSAKAVRLKVKFSGAMTIATPGDRRDEDMRELGHVAARYFDGILDHADRRLRALLLALPDGTYRAEERFDNDCFEPADIRIRVALTIAGDRLKVDFTGTYYSAPNCELRPRGPRPSIPTT